MILPYLEIIKLKRNLAENITLIFTLIFSIAFVLIKFFYSENFNSVDIEQILTFFINSQILMLLGIPIISTFSFDLTSGFFQETIGLGYSRALLFTLKFFHILIMFSITIMLYMIGTILVGNALAFNDGFKLTSGMMYRLFLYILTFTSLLMFLCTIFEDLLRTSLSCFILSFGLSLFQILTISLNVNEYYIFNKNEFIFYDRPDALQYIKFSVSAVVTSLVLISVAYIFFRKSEFKIDSET